MTALCQSLADNGGVRVWRRPGPLIERADIDAILSAMFDIRVELTKIRKALKEEDDGEEEEEDPS